MQVIKLEGIKFQIVVETMEEALRPVAIWDEEKVASKLVATGGMCCLTFTQELIDGLEPMDRRQLKAGPTIYCIQDALGQLSLEEVRALAFHEQGHIVSGHLNSNKIDSNGFIDSLEYEMEADAYAANAVGAKLVRKSLKKLTTGGGFYNMLANAAKIIGKPPKTSQEGVKQWFKEDPGMKARRAALKVME